MFGRMNILEASKTSGQVNYCFLGTMGGVVIQHHADDRAAGVMASRSLHTRLLVNAHGVDRRCFALLRCALRIQRNLLIDQEHFPSLDRTRIALFGEHSAAGLMLCSFRMRYTVVLPTSANGKASVNGAVLTCRTKADNVHNSAAKP